MIAISDEWAMIKVGYMELHKYIGWKHQHNEDMKPYQRTSGPEIPIFSNLALCILAGSGFSVIKTENSAKEQTQYHHNLEGIPGYQSGRCWLNDGISVSSIWGTNYIKMAYFHFIYLIYLVYSFCDGSI